MKYSIILNMSEAFRNFYSNQLYPYCKYTKDLCIATNK